MEFMVACCYLDPQARLRRGKKNCECYLTGWSRRLCCCGNRVRVKLPHRNNNSCIIAGGSSGVDKIGGSRRSHPQRNLRTWLRCAAHPSQVHTALHAPAQPLQAPSWHPTLSSTNRKKIDGAYIVSPPAETRCPGERKINKHTFDKSRLRGPIDLSSPLTPSLP